jgi:RNA recognition motif-containing protein
MASDTTVVYVGNLSWSTTEEMLREFFGPSRILVSLNVQRHGDTNRSKGWGLARFASVEMAKEAIATLNMTELDGRKINLRLDRSFMKSIPEGSVHLYVGNLSWSVSNDDLASLFQNFHPSDCVVMTNMAGRSRGFGIVTVNNEEIAQRAIESIDQLEFKGRTLECRLDRGAVGPSTPKQKQDKTSIFVGNLSSNITDEHLRDVFGQFGQVVHAHAKSSLVGGVQKHWGVVRFSQRSEAENAILHMSGKQLGVNLIDSTVDAAPLIVRFDRR